MPAAVGARVEPGEAAQFPASILHVTESMASGVLQVLVHLARAQTEAGARVHIAHSVRIDTPRPAVLDRLFPPPISREIVPFVTAPSLVGDVRGAVALARAIRRYRPEVIHLHSSKAGALGRVVCRLIGASRVFYSPHGFSFLRMDASPLARRAFFAAEKLLARFGGRIVACSESEGELARRLTHDRNVAVVENAIDLQAIRPASHADNGTVHVVSSGRICHQKAPWKFEALARELSTEGATFTWIGGAEGEPRWLTSGGMSRVNTTGWIDREALLDILASADLYVLLSLYEGMPLGLIEAQAAGLPAVVSDVVGSRDVVRDGVTGFVCRSDEEALIRTRELIRDAGLRRAMGEAGREAALSRFDAHRMHATLWDLYKADE